VIRVGNRALLARSGIALDEGALRALAEMEAAGRTAVLVAEGERAAGVIAVEDRVRADAAEAVAALKALGIRRTVMLTGDSPAVARSVGERLGLDEVGAELFPDAKAARVRQLQAEGCHVAVLGDGINDAPSLVTANVGIAMGKGGTDIAVEAADVVFMTDELMRLPDAVATGRLVLRTIRQNILWFAVILNSVGVLGAGLGIVTPIMAAVGHQIASLCVVCNSLRLLFPQLRIPTRSAPTQNPIPKTQYPVKPSPWVRRWTQWQEATLRLPRAAAGEATLFVQQHRRALARGAMAALALGWLLSGVYTVRAGQVAVVRRFGKLVAADISPGLHYRLPWPVEQLARVDIGSVRRLEVGFRSPTPPAPGLRILGFGSWLGGTKDRTAPIQNPKSKIQNPIEEPASYEWNTRHQAGFQKRQEESLMLTGDEYLVEVNATVQYRVSRPSDFLFAVASPEELLRHAAETAIRDAVGREPLEAVLTGGRARLETEIQASAQANVEHCACGLAILAVRLQDVHPPLEVVNAFRDVASAVEEKGRRINEAEAERNAKIPGARAEAARNVISANGYTFKRVREAGGDAGRFVAMVQGNRAGPQANRIRLYLETVEQVLSGPRKFIVDPRQGGRRQMYLIDGQALAPVPGGAGLGIPGLSVPAPPPEGPAGGTSGGANERGSGRGAGGPAPQAPPTGNEEEAEGP
jgi:HflK protein